MLRREILATIGTAVAAAVAGCSDPDDGGGGYALDRPVEDDTGSTQSESALDDSGRRSA